MPSGPMGFVPTHFVDISEYEERKVELLGSHRSQEEAMRRAVGSGFAEICGRPDAYWGAQVGCRFAECFVAMKARGAVKPYRVLP